MKPPTIDIRQGMESIHVFRGEVLTVYLHSCMRYKVEGDAMQIELRVTPSGVIEIFAPSNVDVINFDNWYYIKKERPQ